MLYLTLTKNPSDRYSTSINNRIEPFFCRTTKEQLSVPLPNDDIILSVEATEDEEALFEILLKKYKKNKLLLMLRLSQLESDARQLLDAIDLSQYKYVLNDEYPADEIDYADYSGEILEIVNRQSLSSKTKRCISLVKELVDKQKPVIVWCMYIRTIQNLSALLEEQGIASRSVTGALDLTERAEILDGFKSGSCQVLITNPNTLAESISLHNICHDAVYFEYSFNLVHLLQSRDRIHRLGLSSSQYTQFYFLQSVFSTTEGPYSLGRQIYERLEEKEHIMIEAIENGRLETQPTTQEDLDNIFGQLL